MKGARGAPACSIGFLETSGELDHIVERAVLMGKDRQIRAADLGPNGLAAPNRGTFEEMSLEDVEAFLIKKSVGPK